MRGNQTLGTPDAILQRVMIRLQIQNHDVAVAGSAEQIHSIFIRLQEDFEFLPEGRGKQRMERPVF